MTDLLPQPPKTVRQFREERDWTQLELARRLGVTPSLVAGWEHGRAQPTLSHRLELARLFGVSVTKVALQETDQA